MKHEVIFTALATSDLDTLKAFERKRVIQQIEKQLVHQPAVATKNRKLLGGLSPGFDFDPHLWELRVGEYRVFYDVNKDAGKVTIRAVRRKEPEQRTEDIVR